jgi:DNA-binding transcriptional LysR family regulator
LPRLRADRLRAFVAVARCGGFSAAARELEQAQSAVSQAVASLEAELGESLFVRDGRRVRLSEAGALLLPRAERAFAEIAAGLDELAARRGLSVGTVRLGTSDTLATYVLPPVFAAFRRRHPGIELRLDNRPSPVVAGRVGDGALDLGIVTLPLPGHLAAQVHTLPLGPQRDALIAPPGHALAARRRVRLADLAPYPLLLLDRTTATRAYLDERFAAARITPRVIMEMNGVEVLKRLVELGFGMSIVPAAAAAREASQRTLALRPIAELGPRTVALVTPTAGPLSPAAQAFIAVARRALARR